MLATGRRRAGDLVGDAKLASAAPRDCAVASSRAAAAGITTASRLAGIGASVTTATTAAIRMILTGLTQRGRRAADTAKPCAWRVAALGAVCVDVGRGQSVTERGRGAAAALGASRAAISVARR